MTKQELFDVIVRGLDSQGWVRCGDANGDCIYSDGNGNHCAIGWLAPECPKEYCKTLSFFLSEFRPDLSTQAIDFFVDAQYYHDSAKTPDEMRSNFKRLAADYDLEFAL